MQLAEERPNTIHKEEALTPRGPWRFLRAALAGSFDGWGLQLILAWVFFQVLTSSVWALHLRSFAGSSALPDYWGELLTARDVWELWENGGLKASPFGLAAPLLALGTLAWAMWAGWKIQARAARVHAGLGSWSLGFLEALVVGLIPLWLIHGAATRLLDLLAQTGIQGLGWLDLVGSSLLRLSLVSFLLLQWWLLRLDLQHQRPENPRDWLWHLHQGALRLWRHPIQWSALVLGGLVLRLGLGFLVLTLAWRWGGGTLPRVWGILILQALVAAFNAWTMGWMLRTVALFLNHDRMVRQEVRSLRALFRR